MKKFLTIAATMLFAMSLTACNTIRGAGQDVEEAGETIQDAAD
ncbi:entericidin A/B family lipoprotein [Hyphobacterium sp.]|jgi:predicted small secreted protein